MHESGFGPMCSSVARGSYVGMGIVSEARVAVDVARGETIGARTAAAVTRGLGRIGGR